MTRNGRVTAGMSNSAANCVAVGLGRGQTQRRQVWQQRHVPPSLHCVRRRRYQARLLILISQMGKKYPGNPMSQIRREGGGGVVAAANGLLVGSLAAL